MKPLYVIACVLIADLMELALIITSIIYYYSHFGWWYIQAYKTD